MLGLLGLATFITVQRTKEIGIRKANGANMGDIITMLVIEFVKWVIYALVIAIPIAYIYLRQWLNNFSYKTNLSWWVFAIASILTLIIAFLSVIIQSYRASLRNPVESLRYE
jgi:putative ABC transport system permease protein